MDPGSWSVGLTGNLSPVSLFCFRWCPFGKGRVRQAAWVRGLGPGQRVAEHSVRPPQDVARGTQRTGRSNRKEVRKRVFISSLEWQTAIQSNRLVRKEAASIYEKRRSEVNKRIPIGVAIVLVLGLALALCPVQGARAAAPRYVATTGTDAGDCSAIANPCLTISYATVSYTHLTLPTSDLV